MFVTLGCTGFFCLVLGEASLECHNLVAVGGGEAAGRRGGVVVDAQTREAYEGEE